MTVEIYKGDLTRFSAWLKKHKKAGLQDGLFSDELMQDAKRYAKDEARPQLLAGLAHLRTVESSTHGTVQIPKRPRAVAPEADEWLIDDAFPSDSKSHRNYRGELRAFSEWLDENGRDPLCDEDRLHSERLLADAEDFVKDKGRSLQVLSSALRELRTWDLTQIRPTRTTRKIPEADRRLSAQYEASFGRRGTFLRSFSAWLQANKKAPLASRLRDDPSLGAELALAAEGKNSRYVFGLKRMLKDLREMLPPGAPSPFPFPPTPSEGWPDVDFLDEPAQQQVMPPSSSTFDSLESLDFRHGQGGREFDRDTQLQEVTGPSWHGTAGIPKKPKAVAPEADEWLIDDAFPGDSSTDTSYRSQLRAFSDWLHRTGRDALCDEDRLHSERLLSDAEDFVIDMRRSGGALMAALKGLRTWDLTGIRPIRGTSSISEAERRLIDQYETAFDRDSRFVRTFVAWLRRQGKTPLASRLRDDPSLDVDLALLLEGKSASYGNAMMQMLRQLREILPPGAPSPFAFPPTPSEGWADLDFLDEPAQPQDMPPPPSFGDLASQPSSSGKRPREWELDLNVATPEATEPSWSTQPETSSAIFDDLESLDSGPRHGGRDGDRDFDLNTPQQEVTGPSPARDAAASEARMPTFDEDDTGRNWEHGVQAAPQWLLDRGAFDQQIVRIRGVEYRVVDTGKSNMWGQPQIRIYPHLRGG
jgi:hypothetical protein